MLGRRRARRRAGLLLLLVTALVLSLGLAEVVVRGVVTPLDTQNFQLDDGLLRKNCYRPSLTLGYEVVPGRCDTNSDGVVVFTSPPVDGARRVRVMLLGDSISTDFGWVARLRSALEAAVPGTAVEVYNHGVRGYNTCQEATVFAERVDAVAPDLVLLQACSNDRIGSPVLLREGGRARYFGPSGTIEFPTVLLSSRLFTLGLLALRAPTAADLREDHAPVCLASIRDGAAERGIPLVSVLFPLLWEADAAPANRLQEEISIRTMHVAVGVPFLDLRPLLEASGPMESHRRYPGDPIHPGDAIGEVIAPALARELAPYFTQ